MNTISFLWFLKQGLWLASPRTPHSLLWGSGEKEGEFGTYEMSEFGSRSWAFQAQPLPLSVQSAHCPRACILGSAHHGSLQFPHLCASDWVAGSVQLRTQLTSGQRLSVVSVSMRLML